MGRENSRWTYTAGTTPEGVIVYDDDTKIHVHNDTCPARGQHSAWDLVRLSLFGDRDAGHQDTPIGDRPSTAAMVELVNALPEIRAARAASELEDLGPPESDPSGPAAAPSGVNDDKRDQPSRFVVHSAGDFSSGPPMGWIVRGVLPRAELAVVFGQPGSSKSFFALDLCGAISRGAEWRAIRTVKGRVVYICGEGASGFKARLKAYAHGHGVGLDDQSFGVIANAPNLLDPADVAEVAKQILAYFKDKP